MKKLFIFLIFFIVYTTVYAQDTLRIMTYNIASGLNANMEQIGQYIKEQKVDIVLLQEVELRTNRPETPHQKYKNQMAELGFYSDMLPIFGKTNLYRTGGYYGLGILSQHHIQSLTNVPLPQVVDKKEPRSMLIATWEINGTTLTIVTTHLSLNKQNREAQMKFIKKYLKKIKGIKLICGDLNSYYTEGLVAHIFDKWQDALPYPALTFPNTKPDMKLDWILYEKKAPIEVLYSEVDSTCQLSDHLPCFADIIINPSKLSSK